MADPVSVWQAERSRLLGLGYRILGSVSDADDIVQDVGLTWLTVDHASIENPAAFLTTLVSRRSIDRLRSAAVSRTTYVGPWLPEPMVTVDDEPYANVALAESVTFGFLTVLERLEPIERAVFVLHEVFSEPFEAIAEIVDRSVVTCRQIAKRARERVRSERRHAAPVAGPHREDLLAAFLGAAAGGDLGTLRSLLRDDAVLVSDGGPNRRAARYPIVGAERIARFMTTLAARVPRDASFELLPVNGVRGVLIRWDGSPQTLIFGEDDGERLVSVWVVRAEAKLRQFEQPSA